MVKLYRPRKVKAPIICVICEREFKPYRSSARFCSQKCKNAFHYRERANAFKAFRSDKDSI